MIDKQIKECHKAIKSLKGFLQILGAGAISIVGMFVFFKEEFSPLSAQILIITLGCLILLNIFVIFRKYAIIEKLNLKGRQYDNR